VSSSALTREMDPGLFFCESMLVMRNLLEKVDADVAVPTLPSLGSLYCIHLKFGPLLNRMLASRLLPFPIMWRMKMFQKFASIV